MSREQRGVLLVFLFLCLSQIVLAEATVNIISPTAGTYNNATILLNISTDGNATWYNFNGTNNTYNTEVEITFNEGENTLYVWANDTDNNITEVNVTFTIDTTAPNITINSPINKTYNNSSITFNVTLNENGTCFYTLDSGATNISMDTADNQTFNHTNSSISDGNYTAIFTCNDTLGNINIKNITFIVDTINPEIYFNNDTTNITTSNTDYIIINVTVNDTNLNYTEINIYNSTNDLINTTNGTYVNYTVPTDGTYYYNATTYDLAGNTNNTETRNTTIDTIPPEITINSPTNIFYNVAEITINITSDGNLTWFFNETDNETYSGVIQRNYTEGTHTLHVWSNDSAGNLNYTNVTFTIDTIYPEIYFNNDTTNITTSNTDYIIINVTVNDTNLNYTQINIYNSTNNLINTTNETYINFTVPTDGLYYYNATTYDLAGHINSTETLNTTIDTILPNLTFTAPSDSGNSNRQYILINVTANKQNILNITIDLYNSSYDLINSTIFFNYTAFINITNLSDDIYYYNATVYDTLERAGYSTTQNVTINTNFPTITLVNPTDTMSFVNRNYIIINTSTTGANITNVTIKLFNSTGDLINFTEDNQSGISYTFSNLSEGIYYFNATVTNTLNYTSDTETSNITIDLTNPSINIGSDSDNGSIINRSNIFINISAADNYLNNITVSIYDNNNTLIYNSTTTNNNITVNYTAPTDGTYYYNATTYDLAGNTNNTETLNTTIDTTSPEITINSPTNIIYNIAEITINITSDGNPTWFFNGTDNETYSGVIQRNYTEGTHTLHVWSNDSAGNLNYTNVTFTIDTIYPEIYFNNDTTNTTISNTNYIIINVTANDTNLNYTEINIYNSTNDLINTTIGTYFNYTVPTDGTYYYNATTYDLAGNTNNTETLNTTIDTTAPTITVNYPASDGVTINISSITVNVTVTDVSSVNSTIYIYYSNGTLLNNTFSNTSENVVTVSNLSDGIYYYNISAYDSFGEYNSTATRTITINTTVPVVTPPVVVSSGGGGGGGGGGGAIISSNTTDSNTTSSSTFSQYWPSIINGSRTINIDRTGMPLLQIVVTTNNNSNVANTITVIAQNNNPYQGRSNLNATIYSFIVFDTTLDNKYVNNLTFRFKVQKRWLTQNNLTADNITLYNYNNNSWSGASVSKYSEDTGYVYYTSNSPIISSMAIGGPLIPISEPVKEEIVPVNDTDNQITTNIIELDTPQKGFFGKIWGIMQNKSDEIVYKIRTSKETQSLMIITVAAILILIVGAVSGILIYKNTIKPRRMRRMYNKQIINDRLMPYEEEPPLQAQEKIVVPPIQVKSSKMPPEIVVAPDPEFNVKKIGELLNQCEYALNAGKLEEAKKFYEESKSIYFNSNLDYEHKAKVYDKIITLHNKVTKSK